MRLPNSLRESLVIAIDDYFETENDDPDASTLAEAVCRLLEAAAEDADLDEIEDILGHIETEAELEESLATSLEDEFTKNDEMELAGEEVVMVLEKLFEIEWADEGLDVDDMDVDPGYGEEDY